ncbi:MAG: acyl-protein synthase [Armatimonadetes bacterium]|nr:acyl-protein synthase [Armatimonadota bacterium]
MSADIPDPVALSSVKELHAWPTPYQAPPAGDDLFVDAMRQITAWHRERNPFYARLAADCDLESVRTVADCARIPFVPATFFKRHELLSIPREQIHLHVTSSGTTGQKSQMFYDAWSVDCTFGILDRIFGQFGWVSSTPASYLLFTYESDPTDHLGTAYTDYYMTRYAPADEIFAALRKTSADGSGHEFDAFGTIEALDRFLRRGLPVRIFGFPSFLWFTMERRRSLDLPPLRLPEGSLVVTGGGWKGYADQEVSKAEVIRRTEEELGIPSSRFSDFYGTVEHGVPYLDCPRHQLHIPIYTRALVRDPRNLALRGWGERGILQFLAPYNTSSPAHCLLTGDWASVHPAEECGCGLKTPYLVLHGRAGRTRNRSCAIAASELLRGRT